MTDTTRKATAAKPAADYRTGAPRRDGWTPEAQATFLIALAESGMVSVACKAAGISTASAYALRREPRGLAFQLGWAAAHLLARDILADHLLEAALNGVTSETVRFEGATRRRSLNTGLSLGVLNRLDKRAASLDDPTLAVARAIGMAWDAWLELVLEGGGGAAIAAFLASHPDPLAAQVAAHAAAKDSAQPRKLVEKSAISDAPRPSPQPSPTPLPAAFAIADRPAAFAIADRPAAPCACPSDRELEVLEAV